MLTIAIGTDHRGYTIKQELIQKELVGHHEITFVDVGTHTPERTNYPPFAHAAVTLVREKKVHGAILLCASGIGMSIAANRFKGIYAAIAWNETIARSAKQDDNANILVLPASSLSRDECIACINAWLSAEFKGGIYQERLALVDRFGS